MDYIKRKFYRKNRFNAVINNNLDEVKIIYEKIPSIINETHCGLDVIDHSIMCYNAEVTNFLLDEKFKHNVSKQEMFRYKEGIIYKEMNEDNKELTEYLMKLFTSHGYEWKEREDLMDFF